MKASGAEDLSQGAVGSPVRICTIPAATRQTTVGVACRRPIAPSVSRMHPVRPELRRDDKCNVSLNDAAARHLSTGAPHHFIIIMSIMACMSFTLTMPLLPFFILSYMDS